jgi:hypothetical protein
MDDMGSPSDMHPARRMTGKLNPPDRAGDGARVINLAAEREKRRKDEADDAYYSNKKILWGEDEPK